MFSVPSAIRRAGVAPGNPPVWQNVDIVTPKVWTEDVYWSEDVSAKWTGQTSYSLTNAPTGMTISAAGLIEWTPTTGQIGNYTAIFANAINSDGTTPSNAFGGEVEAASVGSTDFVFTWETLTDNETLTLPVGSGFSYNYNIDWGDGNSASGITSDSEQDHLYATAGIHTVTIDGQFGKVNFNNGGDAEAMREIQNWGDVGFENCRNSYFGCLNLNVTATDAGNFSGVGTMQQMFRNCNAMTNIRAGIWDISSVNNMTSMLQGATIVTADYDSILVGWESQPHLNAVTFHGGSSTYSSGAPATARDTLDTTDSWSITDGGLA